MIFAFHGKREAGVVPVAVEVWRGGRVESRHRVSACVVDASGEVVLARGDIEAKVFPRSAIKPFQALPLVLSGLADGLDEADLALACASHGGEPAHVERVAAWLERLGLGENDLACGPHPPTNAQAAATLVRESVRPTRLHNNCSGKHTGMLAVCQRRGWPVAGYEKLDHPLQGWITEELSRRAGETVEAPGIDGCSLPAFTMSLRGLARAASALAGTDPALTRIGTAMHHEPFFVAGTGRLCTVLMGAGEGVIAKTGFEGVFLAALPGRGLGIALKTVDGATRAAETALLALLAHLGALPDAPELAAFARPQLKDWNGQVVGEIKAEPGWLA